MSNSDFVKGACRHCAGHLEFPADASGQSAPCPHCGNITELVVIDSPSTTSKSGRKTLAIAVALCVCAVVPATILVMHKIGQGRGTGSTAPVTMSSNGPAARSTGPSRPPEVKPVVETNDFAVMPYQLEKLPGSSLIYVTGIVRNLSAQQRFGVKLAFTLFDTNDMPVGSASDYQGVVDAHGDWHFKAMVMVSKTASARFNSIAEEK